MRHDELVEPPKRRKKPLEPALEGPAGVPWPYLFRIAKPRLKAAS